MLLHMVEEYDDYIVVAQFVEFLSEHFAPRTSTSP